MTSLDRFTIVRIIPVIACMLQGSISQQYSPRADAAPTINVDSLFQYTTLRNQKVITQAIDFVASMQTAPTCTRMAASHLMNECKVLEHAPDFAKSQPEAYLDNVKTEYAAKLAVCELLSAQPINPIPPPHCEILVPSPRACRKSGGWWYSNSEPSSNKQCYPEFKDYRYMQCLKSLQSTPQYWTSFSNARQNAVIMCQASRDAIERESHLEMFKNLTQVIGSITSTMQKTTEDYETLTQKQRRFSDETRENNEQLKQEMSAVQEKALAIVGGLHNEFQDFMKTSISELIIALADSQSAEIAQIQRKMQLFSQDVMTESSQLVTVFASELRHHHDESLSTLRSHHEEQVGSYAILREHMHGARHTANQTSEIAEQAFAKVHFIAQRLDLFESQTEHIAEGFAFLSALPGLIGNVVHSVLATVSLIFVFALVHKINARLAAFTAGICSSLSLLYTCKVFEWFRGIPRYLSTFRENSGAARSDLSPTQYGILIVTGIWLCSYPVSCFNKYMGRVVAAMVNRILRPLWISEYSDHGATALLLRIELPPPMGTTPVSPHTRQSLFGTDVSCV